MDLATILGLVIGMVLVIISICLGDAGIASLKGFLDAPSVFITLGGSFCAVLASNSLSEFIEGLKSIKLVFFIITLVFSIFYKVNLQFPLSLFGG